MRERERERVSKGVLVTGDRDNRAQLANDPPCFLCLASFSVLLGFGLSHFLWFVHRIRAFVTNKEI